MPTLSFGGFAGGVSQGGFLKSKKSVMSLVLVHPSRTFKGCRLKCRSTNFSHAVVSVGI